MNESFCIIFMSLEAWEIITTSSGSYVVCRLIKSSEGTRYALAELSSDHSHCATFLPYSFGWDASANSFCNPKGEALSGFGPSTTIEKHTYEGSDKEVLRFVLLNDELPPQFSDSDTERRRELVELTQFVGELARLAPNDSIAFYSVLRAYGIDMSNIQLLAFGGSFTPARPKTDDECGGFFPEE